MEAVWVKLAEQGAHGPHASPCVARSWAGPLPRLWEACTRHARPASGECSDRPGTPQPLGAPVTAPPAPALPSPPVPSAPPRKVEAEALNATAIRVLWRSPAPGRQHGQIRGYQVHYVRMEGAEARGPPRIKDVMLADAQVRGAGGAGGPRCFSPPGLPAHLLLSPLPPPPALSGRRTTRPNM